MTTESQRLYQKKYYENNKIVLNEKRKAYNKGYYLKNKIKYFEYQREYRKKFLEKNPSYQRDYYLRNKEKILQYHKNYREIHKEFFLNYSKGHRKKNIPYFHEYQKKYISDLRIKSLNKLADFYESPMWCFCCHESMYEFMTIDHKIPVSKTEEKRADPYKIIMSILKGISLEKYQIYCYNCNMGKRAQVDCPHKKYKTKN